MRRVRAFCPRRVQVRTHIYGTLFIFASTAATVLISDTSHNLSKSPNNRMFSSSALL